jgi:uncharacterized protein with NRDE domain
MCLAAFALDAHPRFSLVIAANRDEFFARDAAPMDWWQVGSTELLAGRDLAAGGTWFGLTRSGRLALLTNVREPARHNPGAPTRGTLVVDWLASQDIAAAFASSLAGGYNGFNLITADLARGDWHWISNRSPSPSALPAGIHALSNAALDTPWPKTIGLKAAMAQALADASSSEDLADRLFAALADTSPAPDPDLPDTGIGLACERLLSPRFVRMPDPARPGLAAYGTRCATVLIRDAAGTTQVIERTVTPEGVWGSSIRHELRRWP